MKLNINIAFATNRQYRPPLALFLSSSGKRGGGGGGGEGEKGKQHTPLPRPVLAMIDIRLKAGTLQHHVGQQRSLLSKRRGVELLVRELDQGHRDGGSVALVRAKRRLVAGLGLGVRLDHLVDRQRAEVHRRVEGNGPRDHLVVCWYRLWRACDQGRRSQQWDHRREMHFFLSSEKGRRK